MATVTESLDEDNFLKPGARIHTHSSLSASSADEYRSRDDSRSRSASPLSQNSNSLLSLLAASEEDGGDSSRDGEEEPARYRKPDDAVYGGNHNKNSLTKLQVSRIAQSLTHMSCDRRKK